MQDDVNGFVSQFVRNLEEAVLVTELNLDVLTGGLDLLTVQEVDRVNQDGPLRVGFELLELLSADYIPIWRADRGLVFFEFLADALVGSGQSTFVVCVVTTRMADNADCDLECKQSAVKNSWK